MLSYNDIDDWIQRAGAARPISLIFQVEDEEQAEAGIKQFSKLQERSLLFVLESKEGPYPASFVEEGKETGRAGSSPGRRSSIETRREEMWPSPSSTPRSPPRSARA